MEDRSPIKKEESKTPVPYVEKTTRKYKSRGVLPKYIPKTTGALTYRKPIIDSSISHRFSLIEKIYKDPKYREAMQMAESIPYTRTRVLNKTTESQGEYPIIPFILLREYRDNTPQLKKTAEIVTDLIVGRKLLINCDDDDAKKICEDFAIDTDLHRKTRNIVDMAYSFGYGIFVKVYKSGELVNIEDFDTTQIYRMHRDEKGNPIAYVYLVENGAEEYIKDIENHVPLAFDQRQRDPFGYAFFHSSAVPRRTRNRLTPPLVEELWAAEDAMTHTITNYVSPTTYYALPNLEGEALEKEVSRIQQQLPGDKVIVQGEMPEIKTVDAGTPGKFDSYIRHLEKTMMLSTGFPYEILTGDFTSRASSETTENFYMRSIRAKQAVVSDRLTREIFYTLLMNHPSGKWNSKEKLQAINLSVAFDTKVSRNYTPEQAQARYNAGVWTLNELRQYDKNNGQDLFEDELVVTENKTKKESVKAEAKERKRANDLREKEFKTKQQTLNELYEVDSYG